LQALNAASSVHVVAADSLPGSACPTRLPMNEVNHIEEGHHGGVSAILCTVSAKPGKYETVPAPLQARP
jgi:hypothetical protein